MTANDERYTFDRVIRILLTVGAAVALFALVRYLSDVLIPFVVAVVLAYLLNPLVTWIEHKTKGRRGLAVAATLAGIGVLGLIAIGVLVPVMGLQVRRFERTWSQLRTSLPVSAESLELVPTTSEIAPAATTQTAGSEKQSLGWNELLEGWDAFHRTAEEAPLDVRLHRLYAHVEGTQVGELMLDAARFVRTQAFRDLLIASLKRLSAGGLTVINFAVELALGATVLVVILIYLVFLLLDLNAYALAWRSMLPPKYRDGVLGFLEEFEAATRRYFRGQFVVALLVGVLFSIGFTVIGLPMAIPLGLLVGLLNMVPYLQIVALIPAGLLAVLRSIETSGSLLGSVALVLLVFAIIQVLQDAVIVPRVMGKATGLRPVSILLGVFIWGKLLGFIGLVLAIPLTCLGIAYYRRYVLTHSLAADSPVITRT